MKRALVTGGGGFVGRAVVKMLAQVGVKCTVIGRNNYPDLDDIGVTCLIGDIQDLSFLMKAVKNVDTVFHIAALAGIWGKWSDYYGTNVLGTQNVIESCLANNVATLVYTSTPSVVFNRSDIMRGTEKLPYAENVLCYYAKSKIMAERMILQANGRTLSTCAIRPHLVWGPGDPHLLPRLVAKGRKKQLKIVGDGTNLVDISYVENVAYAHVLAGQNLMIGGACAGKAYFVSQGEPVNLWNWINTLFAAMDIPLVERKVSFQNAYRIGAILELLYKGFKVQKEPPMTRFIAEQLAKSHYFDIANAHNDFGYAPQVTTEEGLRKSVNWLKKQEDL